MKKEINMKTRKFVLAMALVALMMANPKAQNGSVKFYGPLSRYITPTSGNLNSTILFCFDNPSDSGIVGTIYDLRGSKIAQMSSNEPAQGTGCPQSGFLPQYVSWNGRSSNGGIVASGVYIYQIAVESHIYSGTVVVVR
jgi:hypothetical protein